MLLSPQPPTSMPSGRSKDMLLQQSIEASPRFRSERQPADPDPDPTSHSWIWDRASEEVHAQSPSWTWGERGGGGGS